MAVSHYSRLYSPIQYRTLPIVLIRKHVQIPGDSGGSMDHVNVSYVYHDFFSCRQYENKTSSEEDFIRWATEQLLSFRLDYVDIQRFSANGATDLTDIVLVYPSNGTHRDLQSIPWTGENGHSPFELLSKKSQIQVVMD